MPHYILTYTHAYNLLASLRVINAAAAHTHTHTHTHTHPHTYAHTQLLASLQVNQCRRSTYVHTHIYAHTQLLASLQVFNSAAVSSVTVRRGHIAAGSDTGKIKQISLSLGRKKRGPTYYEDLHGETGTQNQDEDSITARKSAVKQVELAVRQQVRGEGGDSESVVSGRDRQDTEPQQGIVDLKIVP